MSKGGGQTPAGDYLMSVLPENYQSAKTLATKPFTPYTGQLVAQPTAAIQQGQAAITSGALTAGQQALDSAIAGTTKVQNFAPAQVRAPTAKAITGQAASSGVYSVVPQPMPVPTGGETTMGTPQQAMSPSSVPPLMSRAQARMDRRAARRGFVATHPAAPTTPVPASASAPVPSAPAGPTVAAMQGLQGLDAYFNPYASEVADRTLADLNRLRQMSISQNGSDAALNSAFGGDRQAVTDALTNEAFARQAADALAGLYSQGFDASSGLLMSDKDRLLQNQQFNAGLQQQMNLANMGASNQFALANQAAKVQAALANQNANLQGAQVNLAGSQQLGNLANQQQQQLLTGANAVTAAGLQQQAQQQAQLDAAYQQFLREQAYPYQQQDVLNKALGMFGIMQGQYTAPNYPLADLVGGMAPGLGRGIGQGLGALIAPAPP
jgi:hypothetical protein